MVRSVEQRGQSWPLENVRILACLKEGEERKKKCDCSERYIPPTSRQCLIRQFASTLFRHPSFK